MTIERDINHGGEKFLLAALEKIATGPLLTATQMRVLAKQAIAYATTPLDCPGLPSGTRISHLFNDTHCARCGLAASDYLGGPA